MPSPTAPPLSTARDLPARSPLRALVRGAGPTGTLAALALADAGWVVTLVDPSTPSRILARSRAYAFTHSSRRLLCALGLWERLVPVLEPFERLHVRDLGCRQSSRFGSADLRVRGSGPQPVGWIGGHRPLMEVLLAAVEAQPAIHLQLGASDTVASGLDDPLDDLVDVDLIVAADGPHSPTRQKLGIGSWQHAYRQHCLSSQVILRGAPAGTAWELLRPEGPFALLPMGDRRFQVVWSAPGWRCRQLESLSPAAFLDALAAVLPAGIEVASLLEPPRAFPVSLQVARRLQKGRTVLAGETAHRCHPVGGQGLNLCWRDVAVLHELARRAQAGRLASDRIGGRYARRRWVDLLLTLLVTDSLVRLFSNRQPLLLALRQPTMRMLAKAPPLRRWVLGAMTHGPCQPFQAVSP